MNTIKKADNFVSLLYRSQMPDEFFFAFFSLGFVKKLLRKRKPAFSNGLQKHHRREPIST